MRGTWFVLALFAVGCGGKDGDGGGTAEGCDSCAENGEACTVYADGDIDDWTESCAAMPAECTGDDPCGITECVSALYGLCDAGYIGQSNSCAPGGFVSVTCSPDA